MSRLKILSWWWGCQVIGGQKGHLFALGAQECDIIRSSTCKRSSCEVSIVQLIAQKSQQDLCFASKWHSTKGSGTTLIETLSDHTQWRNHPFFVLLRRFFFEDDNQASRTNIKEQRTKKSLKMWLKLEFFKQWTFGIVCVAFFCLSIKECWCFIESRGCLIKYGCTPACVKLECRENSWIFLPDAPTIQNACHWEFLYRHAFHSYAGTQSSSLHWWCGPTFAGRTLKPFFANAPFRIS